ncbi:MAG: M15 family metallopeptidase [Bdellovibrionota bacterium]
MKTIPHQEVQSHPEFTALRTISGIQIRLRYASKDNFLGRDVYKTFREAYLQKDAARMLEDAAGILLKKYPGHQLLIFDALRPRSVQRVLWEHVLKTGQTEYVADPDKGSMHNFGCAVDLSVTDAQGRELDMGTGFDSFTKLSEPRHEPEFLASGELKKEQLENRKILRHVMTDAGFIQLPHEWWHYDAFPREIVRARFAIVE